MNEAAVSNFNHFGVFGAPPILEPIVVVGLNRMLPGATIFVI